MFLSIENITSFFQISPRKNGNIFSNFSMKNGNIRISPCDGNIFFNFSIKKNIFLFKFLHEKNAIFS